MFKSRFRQWKWVKRGWSGFKFGVCSLLQRLNSIHGLITAIATALLVFVTFRTDTTLHSTLVSANRAWLAPHSMSWHPDYPADVGAPLHYVLAYENLGREPALDVAIFHEESGPRLLPIADRKNLGDVFAGQVNKSCEPELGKWKIPGKGYLVVYPSREYKLALGTSFVIPPEVGNGSHILFLQGCIAYSAFKKIRYSAYCFMLTHQEGKPMRQWPFTICPTGNFAN